MSAWLTSPRAFAPGTRMAFGGLANPQERADLLLYLNAQGGHLTVPPPPAAAPPAATSRGNASAGNEAAPAGNAANAAAPAGNAAAAGRERRGAGGGRDTMHSATDPARAGIGVATLRARFMSPGLRRCSVLDMSTVLSRRSRRPAFPHNGGRHGPRPPRRSRNRRRA